MEIGLSRYIAKGFKTMLKEVVKNRKAWEHRVYEWRVNFQGTPLEVAKQISLEPKKFLRFHADFFRDIRNKKIASICGSDGRRAVALAVLGANPTVFDVSEPQMKYAYELAKEANVKIGYELGDFCSESSVDYSDTFDIAYAEGGILHYFHDLPKFFGKVYSILADGGMFIMSDYHPFQKTCVVEKPTRNVEMTNGNYFDDRIHTGHVPYLKYFPENERNDFPPCELRFYTLSEIFNAMISSRFIIESFYEHPKTDDGKVPFEYTIVARKSRSYMCFNQK